MTTKAAKAEAYGILRHHDSLLEKPHPLKKLDSFAALIRNHRSEPVCCQGQPADYWYCVISGAARRSVIRADGRRQILGLLLPGDFFGFTPHAEYDFAVEIIAEGTVLIRYPRRRAEALADCDPQLAHEIRDVAFQSLSRLEAQLLILGRITALEKVGCFIAEIASRLSDGRAGAWMVLPISRYDIADYLAVSVETVSRSLTDLKQRGVIELTGARNIKIVDRKALQDPSPGELRAPAPRREGANGVPVQGMRDHFAHHAR